MTEQEGRSNLARVAKLYDDRTSWERRAAAIRTTIIAGSRLDFGRKRCDLTPIVSDFRQLEGYQVANVAVQSLPGFWVTGNLYRPTEDIGPIDRAPRNETRSGAGSSGGVPAILCPHGHWCEPGDHGRFRADMQYRCASLARMGAVVFAYDMVGFGESTQVAHDYPYALALQLWNSIRCIDFLASLSGIDTDRIGATGASGGASQTILLAAVDERVALSVPVVMVSAHSDGGCQCEIGMPVRSGSGCETNNVEIAATAAPRPMLLVSDGDDWTANTPEVEYPFIRRIYDFYGAATKLEFVHLPDEEHDYGFSKREAAYRFIGRHFSMDLDAILDDVGRVDERFVSLLSEEKLQVFAEVGGRPSGSLVGSDSVTRELFAGERQEGR